MASGERRGFDQLQSGVTILADGAEWIRERVQLSNGIVPAEQASNGRSYRPGASVPRGPWRTPAPAEIQLLLAQPGPWQRLNSVAVQTVERELLEQVGPARLRLVEGKISPREFDRLVRAMLLTNLELLVPLCVTPRWLKYVGSTVARPGLWTVTQDAELTRPDDVRFLGLHFDFPGRRSAHRPSWNRLCINVGDEERHFLFVNQPMDRVLTDHDFDPSAAGELTGPYLGDAFCLENPSYPVIKLLIRPGEAYLALTHAIIHDGTTATKSRPDVCLHFLGDFAPRETVSLARAPMTASP